MADHNYTTHKITNRSERVVAPEEDFGIPKDIPRHASGFPVNPWNRTYEQMVAIAEADRIEALGQTVVDTAVDNVPAEIVSEADAPTEINSASHATIDASDATEVAIDEPIVAVTDVQASGIQADLIIPAGHDGIEVKAPHSLFLFDVIPPPAAAPVARRAPDPMAKQIRQVNASLQGLFEANGVILEGSPAAPGTRRTKALSPEVANVKLAELLGMPAAAVATATDGLIAPVVLIQNEPEIIRPTVVAAAEEMELPSI